MKKIVFYVPAVLLILLAGVNFLVAETPEEQFLRQKEQKINSYYYQARSGDRNQKIMILDAILKEFDEFKYSSRDKKLVDLVIMLSEEGSVRQEFENGRLINDFPEVRRKAVMVLGRLGGDQARDALINILVEDQDMHVKAEVCNALAKVKDNSNGEALRALVHVYRTTYKPDPNFVLAIITAVKSIAQDNVNAYADAIAILSEIQMGNYNRALREEAYKAIQELSGIN